jgi:hypothetical protein
MLTGEGGGVKGAVVEPNHTTARKLSPLKIIEYSLCLRLFYEARACYTRDDTAHLQLTPKKQCCQFLTKISGRISQRKFGSLVTF